MTRLLMMLISCCLLTGCYYDNEESLYPSIGTCDTAQVTYAKSIAPLIISQCLACHSNNAAASSGGNIRLESYADVKIYADNGRLYGAVAHLSGYSPMPKSGGKLDGCKIATLKKWIDSGAPNN